MELHKKVLVVVELYCISIENIFYHLWMGYGDSTNIKSWLLALWMLLNFARNIGIPFLQCFGDSLVIIKWFLGLSKLGALDISH